MILGIKKFLESIADYVDTTLYESRNQFHSEDTDKILLSANRLIKKSIKSKLQSKNIEEIKIKKLMHDIFKSMEYRDFKIISFMRLLFRLSGEENSIYDDLLCSIRKSGLPALSWVKNPYNYFLYFDYKFSTSEYLKFISKYYSYVPRSIEPMKLLSPKGLLTEYEAFELYHYALVSRLNGINTIFPNSNDCYFFRFMSDDERDLAYYIIKCNSDSLIMHVNLIWEIVQYNLDKNFHAILRTLSLLAKKIQYIYDALSYLKIGNKFSDSEVYKLLNGELFAFKAKLARAIDIIDIIEMEIFISSKFDFSKNFSLYNKEKIKNKIKFIEDVLRISLGETHRESYYYKKVLESKLSNSILDLLVIDEYAILKNICETLKSEAILIYGTGNEYTLSEKITKKIQLKYDSLKNLYGDNFYDYFDLKNIEFTLQKFIKELTDEPLPHHELSISEASNLSFSFRRINAILNSIERQADNCYDTSDIIRSCFHKLYEICFLTKDFKSLKLVVDLPHSPCSNQLNEFVSTHKSIFSTESKDLAASRFVFEGYLFEIRKVGDSHQDSKITKFISKNPYYDVWDDGESMKIYANADVFYYSTLSDAVNVVKEVTWTAYQRNWDFEIDGLDCMVIAAIRYVIKLRNLGEKDFTVYTPDRLKKYFY